MTLETVYYITQILAVGAILASLVAIYWQQREANKLARVQNSEGLTASYADSLRDLMNSAELASIFRKVMFEGEVLDPIETTRILFYFNLMITGHHKAWVAQENGLYDEESFNIVIGNTAWYLSKPIFLAEWRRIKAEGIFIGGFAEHIDSLIKPIAKITPQPDEEQADGGPNA